MAASNPVPSHLASNPFEDLSGISTSSFSNPYDALLAAANNDPTQLRDRYEFHRTTRNRQQRAKLTDPSFSGVIFDPILHRLENPEVEPGFEDPRHCLVFWARPPQHIKNLIYEVQQKLLTVAPNLWLMPLDNLHLTVLEITHSKTAPEIASLAAQLQPAVTEIVNYPSSPARRARLIKPAIGFDAAAIALSFVPAAGEGLSNNRQDSQDAFTYHHLRRDVYAKSSETGVKVDSRYVVPSAHLTIGRFVQTSDFETEATVDVDKMKGLVDVIERTNVELRDAYWPREGKGIREGGEWIVGEGKGLDLRQGQVWYGGGNSIVVGKGF